VRLGDIKLCCSLHSNLPQNHRIIGWKRPLKSSCPTITLTPPCLLNHVMKCHICTFFEHLQGWDSTTSLHSLVQCLTALSVEEIFPNIQSEPPLMQLEAISSHPIASYLGEETKTCLTTISFQVDAESKKVPPQPPLLWTKQSQSLGSSAAPHKACALDPSPALLFSLGTWVCATEKWTNYYALSLSH